MEPETNSAEENGIEGLESGKSVWVQQPPRLNGGELQVIPLKSGVKMILALVGLA
jgi:hypothetical protein